MARGRSNVNWIDGPQGGKQWTEEQTWNEASLFSLQRMPCSPVATKNQWEPLQDETSAWEEEELPFTGSQERQEVER